MAWYDKVRDRKRKEDKLQRRKEERPDLYGPSHQDLPVRGPNVRGYQPQTRWEMQALLDFFSGKRESTEGIPASLLSTRYGTAPRTLTRLARFEYMTDPGVTQYRKFMRGMQKGGVGKQLKAIAADAANRTAMESRMRTSEAFHRGLGGGVRAPGLSQYINMKQDAALSGALGDAFRQAALADLSFRQAAGEALLSEANYRTGLLYNIANAAAGSSALNQPTTGQGGNFFKDLAQMALSAGVGYFTGGLGGAAAGALGGSLFGSGKSSGQYPKPGTPPASSSMPRI